MSNPKDWFRRRRRDSPLVRRSEDDPFEGPILQLTSVAGEASHLGAIAAAANEADARHAVIPPPPRQPGLRMPHVIESSTFAIRPEVVKTIPPRLGAEPNDGPEPQRSRPGATEIKPGPSELIGSEPTTPEPTAAGPTAAGPAVGVSMRHRAVPFARSAAAQPVVPRQAPSDRPYGGRAAPSERFAGGGETGMPTFTLAAPGVGWLRGRQQDGSTANAALREAFTPTRPKRQGTQFSGRNAQMQRIINAIEEERAHVVLYGERGSGKTSLANIIAAQAEKAGYFVVKFACSSEISFEDIFRSFLRRIPATFLAGGIGATNRSGISHFEELLAPGEIGIAELVGVFARLHEKHVILVIDEYDRVTSETTKSKLAELIKNMSDASAPTTLLLIGVAEDVDELLGKHPSLQRTLVTIPLPLMTAAEIDAIIVDGGRKFGRRFAGAVRARIVELAQGLPYHAQLLCLFAARSALRRHSAEVEGEDLRYAVQRAAEEAEGKIKEAYALAVAGSQGGGTAFKDVLFAAARCIGDAFGTFAVDDVARAALAHGINLSALALQFPLKKLTEPGRGAMLRRFTGLDGLRYQFVNQMLRHHVLARQAIERGLV
jgi:Cdc6-like AAA superfamily ATPase